LLGIFLARNDHATFPHDGKQFVLASTEQLHPVGTLAQARPHTRPVVRLDSAAHFGAGGGGLLRCVLVPVLFS
jgi:hypothetical protein